eukprot:8188443-Pyramimonas_sp.AAC.1
MHAVPGTAGPQIDTLGHPATMSRVDLEAAGRRERGIPAANRKGGTSLPSRVPAVRRVSRAVRRRRGPSLAT